MLSNPSGRIAALATAGRLRWGMLRYLAAAAIILSLSFVLPTGTLRDARIIIPFLAVTACAWYAGVGPGIVSLWLVVVVFKYRAGDFAGTLIFSGKELSTVGALTVVIGSVGWAGRLRRQSQLVASRQALELRALHRRKDEFLATLAHELRNPLAPLRSSLDLLRLARQRPDARMDIDDIHGVMQRQLDQLVRLIDDLLELSRINAGRIELRREAVLVSEVIRAAVETSRPHIETAQHALSVTIPNAPIAVHADRIRLTQVLTNLLNNAAKFTPPGGRITLSACQTGGDVVIVVRDTGIGISPEMLPRVFEMFTQVPGPHPRAQGGLGIGLCLAQSVIELHGGAIQAASGGLGTGSEFVVTLPVCPVPEPERGGAPNLARRSSQKNRRRILIVDDNADAARSLALLLSADGHECHVVGDGQAALDVASHFDPHVFLIDLGMPAMSGYELAGRLRAIPQFGGALLVAVTGWGQEEDRQKSRAAGFDVHLVKPVSTSALSELLEPPPRGVGAVSTTSSAYSG